MMRFLYCCLLWLHPAVFRRQFADEMLWIFDKHAPAHGSGRLFVDGCVSLARQWLVRTAAWRFAAAAGGALLQSIVLGRFLLSGHIFTAGHRVTPAEISENTILLRALLPITICVLLFVIVLVLWLSYFARQRSGRQVHFTVGGIHDT